MTHDDRDGYDFLPMNPRDYLVLFSLLNGDRHGYGIVKEIEASSGGTVRMDPSNLHRSLKRLIRDGLVEDARLDEEAGSQSRRRYYRITAFGVRVVRAEATRLAELTRLAEQRAVIGS